MEEQTQQQVQTETLGEKTQAPAEPVEGVIVPQPVLRTILFIYNDGSIGAGTPQTLQLAQNGNNVELLNRTNNGANSVATFLNAKVERVESNNG